MIDISRNVFWSERSACAALGHCRQNVVATIHCVFLSLSPHFIFLPEGVVVGSYVLLFRNPCKNTEHWDNPFLAKSNLIREI